jgi:hypothetical protein
MKCLTLLACFALTSCTLHYDPELAARNAAIMEAGRYDYQLPTSLLPSPAPLGVQRGNPTSARIVGNNVYYNDGSSARRVGNTIYFNE